LAASYSHRLFSGSVPAGSQTTVLQVPNGETVVVRDLEVFLGTPDTLCNVQAGPTGSFGIIFYSAANTGSSYQQWQGRVVLEEGDELALYSSSTGTLMYISGYRFNNT